MGTIDFTTAVDIHLRRIGEEILVTSPQGEVTRITEAGWKTGRPQTLQSETQREDGQTRRVRTATVDVRLADLAHVEARSTVTRVSTGETWTVIYADKPRNAKWAIRVQLAITTDQTTGHYR